MKNKQWIAAVAVLAVLVVVLLGVWMANRPETSRGSKQFTVSVVHGDGSVKEFAYRTDAEFLGDVLTEEGLIAGEDGPYGLTILTVDGEDALWDADGAYWALYVGGEYAVTGISTTPVYDGSSFTLEYTLG